MLSTKHTLSYLYFQWQITHKFCLKCYTASIKFLEGNCLLLWLEKINPAAVLINIWGTWIIMYIKSKYLLNSPFVYMLATQERKLTKHSKAWRSRKPEFHANELKKCFIYVLKLVGKLMLSYVIRSRQSSYRGDVFTWELVRRVGYE